MAKDKRGRKLPRGIRATQNGFEGRFMLRGISYSVTGKTVREVQQRLTEARYKAEHGVIVAPEAITFEEWASVWFNEYYKPTVRESSSVTTWSTIHSVILPALGAHRLADIREEHIQQLLNSLSGEYSATVIKRTKGTIARMLRQAVRNRLISVSPAEFLTIPKTAPAKPRVALTEEQQRLFLDYSKDSWFAAMFALALRTGMRIGEVLALRTTDIDFRSNVIHVNKTVARAINARYTEGAPKTRSSKRDIPITTGTAQLLRDHIKGRMVASIEQRLFCDWDGSRFNHWRVNAEIRRICERIREDGHDMPDFTFHTFRHTFATRAIENGMNPQTLKTILGHSSLEMTMDLYSHVLADTKAKEMESIDRAFNL